MEDIKNLLSELTEYNIRFEENVLLKNRTWIKTGGVASLFILISASLSNKKI